MSRALLRTGRRAEGVALVRKVATVFKPQMGLTLNLSAAEITQAADVLEWDQVVPLSERWLATARSLGPDVNQSAILQVTALKACGLYGVGRAVEAEARAAEVTIAQRAMPGAAFMVDRCRSDVAGARTLVRAMLSDEDQRAWALALMQPTEDIPDRLPAMPWTNGSARRSSRTLRYGPSPRRSAGSCPSRCRPRSLPASTRRSRQPLSGRHPAASSPRPDGPELDDAGPSRAVIACADAP